MFINHGHREARLGLQQAIEGHVRQDGQRLIKEVQLACSEKWYDLDAHKWLEPELPEGAMSSKMLNDLLQEQKKTNELLGQLLHVIAQFSSAAYVSSADK